MWRSAEQRRTTEERLGRREDRANFLNFFLAFLLKQQSGSCLFALSVRPQRVLKTRSGTGAGATALRDGGGSTRVPVQRQGYLRTLRGPPTGARSLTAVTARGHRKMHKCFVWLWLGQLSSAHRPAAAGFQPSSSVRVPPGEWRELVGLGAPFFGTRNKSNFVAHFL